jgi:hypothetical protein
LCNSSSLGGVLGFGFGTFFSAANPTPDDLVDKPLMKQMVEGFKQSGRAGWAMGKNFATVGLVYSSTECTIEWVCSHNIND